ncbi:MAG: MBL fold metallo-hydrolase [bacterium]|nr:MBL fold metallo-hydrolase [bacterium]
MQNFRIILTFIILLAAVSMAGAQEPFGSDIIETSKGDLKIVFLGHGSLMLEFDNTVIYADPVGRNVDYSAMPKADLVLITHEHGDHLNAGVLDNIKKSSTFFVMNPASAKKYKADNLLVMENGDDTEAGGYKIEAVPAYNIERTQYHPKGNGNGYVITLGDKRIYIGGDTEYIPEMKDLKNIHVAFLPMNMPYTMTVDMVVEAAKAFKPKLLYPYHYSGSDTDKLIELLKDLKGVEVRVRTMY